MNPFEYLARHGTPTPFDSEAAYNAAMTEACLSSQIEVVGITDHYRVKTSAELAKALRAAGIVVFQGFEAVSKDGVHFLCLFDPKEDEGSIDRRIGECGVASLSMESPIGHFDAIELLERVAGWGAICIAAHVASQGGLLKKLTGQSAMQAWKSPHLLACSLPGPLRMLLQGWYRSSKTRIRTTSALSRWRSSTPVT